MFHVKHEGAPRRVTGAGLLENGGYGVGRGGQVAGRRKRKTFGGRP